MAKDRQGPAAGSLRSALAHRPFRLYLGAVVVSATGDFLYSVALLVVIYGRTGSPTWVAVTAFGRVLVWSAAAAVGGVLGDRFDRRRLIIGLNLALGAVMALVTLSAALDLSLGIIVMLATVTSALSGLVNPLLPAAVPAVVGEDDLAAANAAVTTVEQVSTVAGPAVGAILVTATSPSVVMAVDGVSFVVAAALFAMVRLDAAAPADDEPERKVRFRDGIGALRSSPAAAALVSLLTVSLFVYGFEFVVQVLVAVERLGLEPQGFGWLTMATGIGGVAAAIVAGRLAALNSPTVVVFAGVFTGLPMVTLAFITSTPLALGVLVVEGAAYVVLEVVVVTQLQRTVSDDKLARVFGIMMALGSFASAAGILFAPVLDSIIGLQGTLIVAGLVLVVFTFAIAPVLPAIAREAESRRLKLAPKVEVLRSLGLFSEAPELALENLAGALVEQVVEAGVAVVTEGDPADDLYIVREGSLDVTSTGESGGEPRLVNTMGPDDWFGEIGLLAEIPRTATVTTTSECTLWRIPGEVFLAALEQAPVAPDAVRLGMLARLARTHPSHELDPGGATPAGT